jgi:hypothetical protein
MPMPVQPSPASRHPVSAPAGSVDYTSVYEAGTEVGAGEGVGTGAVGAGAVGAGVDRTSGLTREATATASALSLPLSSLFGMDASIQLALPPLDLDLPDYLSPHLGANEAELLALRTALQGLVKAAQDGVARQHAVKRLEEYRFDRLSFTQKFVRPNSSSKNMVAEGMCKCYRDIGICERRVVELQTQLDTLLTVLLPAARRAAELRAAHTFWPRPGRYESPMAPAWHTQGQGRGEGTGQGQGQGAARGVSGGDTVDGGQAREDLGEGIGRPVPPGGGSGGGGGGGLFLPLPCVLRADGNGFERGGWTPSSAGGGGLSLPPSPLLSPSPSPPLEYTDFDTAQLLWAELNRLKIARGLKLRELGIILNGDITGYSEEINKLHIDINELNASLISAAQTYLENSINGLPLDAGRAECGRVSRLCDHQYAAEVFARAGVLSWGLTGREQEAAADEWRVIKERAVGTRRREEGMQRSMSVADRINSSCRLRGGMQGGGAAAVSGTGIGIGVEGAADALLAASLAGAGTGAGEEAAAGIVSQLVRLQGVVCEKDACLQAARGRYKGLTISQRYIRRGQSKTGVHLREEKVILSEELVYLRAEILSLRERLNLCTSIDGNKCDAATRTNTTTTTTNSSINSTEEAINNL